MKNSMSTLVVILCLFTAFPLSAQTSKEDPVYLETISNSSKSINFIAGVYPKTLVYSAANDNTKLTLRVLNNATDTYKWKDFKVYIMLKDNSLFYNYTTKAESGEFACEYAIDGDKGYHDQTVCFSKKFSTDDIKQMWLCFADDTFINLIYVPGK